MLLELHIDFDIQKRKREREREREREGFISFLNSLDFEVTPAVHGICSSTLDLASSSFWTTTKTNLMHENSCVSHIRSWLHRVGSSHFPTGFGSFIHLNKFNS